MYLLVVIGNFALVFFVLKKALDWKRAAMVVGTVALFSFLGARLFHVMVEQPTYYLDHPKEILSRWDGLTFYGALLGGALGLQLTIQLRIPTVNAAILWNLGAILTALDYLVLRLACFANGCCWGKITNMPWKVSYGNPDSAMPLIGIPVHPVQLYDSLHGLIILILLVVIKQNVKDRSINLFPPLLILYSLGRFLTEFYRGDNYRITNIFSVFSLSQVISLVILLMTYSWYHRLKMRRLYAPFNNKL